MNFLVTFGKTSIKFSVIQVMVISKEVGKKATGLFSTKLKEVRRALLTEKTPPKQTKQNKHDGANAMSWSCMTAIETRSLVFVNPITADKSSRMTSEVLRPILWKSNNIC